MFALPQDFFERYWQREPLLIRDAVADFRSPLSPDELAGLACIEDAEARIVIESGCAVPWEVRHGPFAQAVFATLPESHWTLLVQAVDHWDEEVAALRRSFPQIPNWRIDDVMVSYAATGGSVGPHYDYYDVFLLQGLGRRRWRLGGPAGSDAVLRPGLDLRLLQDFEVEVEYLLGPGDALYLPPGYAHWGIAEGECMTYSIGFRAPADAEIVDCVAAYIADRLPEDERYTDPPLGHGDIAHPGEITAEVIARVVDSAHRHLTPEMVSKWFGSYVTERKYPQQAFDFDEPSATRRLDAGDICRPVVSSRFAFTRDEGGFDLYADGYSLRCPAGAAALVLALCDGEPLADRDQDGFRQLVLELLRNRSIEFE